MFNTIAMAEGFSRILTLEGAQTGSHFDNLTDQYFAYSVADALIFLTIDTFVYGLVALYIDKVVPGEYGTSLPFYFPFLPSF